MIMAVACQCGSSDMIIRSRLGKFGCPEALTIPVIKGKDRSLAALDRLPHTAETAPIIAELSAYISGHSKWAILVGYASDIPQIKWVDLANGSYLQNDVDAELLIKHFSASASA